MDYKAKSLPEHDHFNIWHTIAINNFDFRNQTVLDVGCGTGRFLEHIRDMGAKILGIDPNSENERFAKKRNIPFFQGTLEDFINTRDMRVFSPTVITCFEVIEHIDCPHSLVSNAYKILSNSKQGGRLILTTPNAFNIMRAIDFILFQRHRDAHMDPVRMQPAEHIRAYSVGMVVNLLKMHNFTVNRKDIWRGRNFGRYFNSNIVASGVLSAPK